MTPASGVIRSVALVGFGGIASFAACDGNEAPSSALGIAQTIGARGGTVAVRGGPLAGASITFPPGALQGPTLVQLRIDQVSSAPGLVEVGPAVRVEPAGLELLQSSVLVLPFDPARVPSAVRSGDFAVRLRQADGRQQELLPRQVDQGLGRVTVDVLQLGTYWVAVPDLVRVVDYLPLLDGSRYDFDNGIVLDVADTLTEPNFAGIELHKLRFTAPAGLSLGFYFLHDPGGAILLAGEFEDALESRQERLDHGALLLDPAVTVGTERESFYSFLGFQPFGSPLPTYVGTAEAFSAIAGRAAVSVPAGRFEDVVVWEWFTVGSDTRPRGRGRLLRMWLARGIGPVQVQVDDVVTMRLVATNVGG